MAYLQYCSESSLNNELESRSKMMVLLASMELIVVLVVKATVSLVIRWLDSVSPVNHSWFSSGFRPPFPPISLALCFYIVLHHI